VVEALDYEIILSEMLTDLRARAPEFDALVESDPAYKVLEVCAYRELLLRQRVNDAARACMLATSAGADLDHLAALFDVERKLLDPGDPDLVPPRDPVWEDDESLRVRTQMALEGTTVAGSELAYVFHALTVPSVRDASVISPAAGQVSVYVLGRDGDGTPDAETLEEVLGVLDARDVRPLTDQVSVHAAEIVTYNITATLQVRSGPDLQAVYDEALKAITSYVETQHRMGADIPLSGIYAALHRTGVVRVLLNDPVADVVIDTHEAGWCAQIDLAVQEVDSE
jgi:phage-related baseplate assembly protein